MSPQRSVKRSVVFPHVLNAPRQLHTSGSPNATSQGDRNAARDLSRLFASSPGMAGAGGGGGISGSAGLAGTALFSATVSSEKACVADGA